MREARQRIRDIVIQQRGVVKGEAEPAEERGSTRPAAENNEAGRKSSDDDDRSGGQEWWAYHLPLVLLTAAQLCFLTPIVKATYRRSWGDSFSAAMFSGVVTAGVYILANEFDVSLEDEQSDPEHEQAPDVYSSNTNTYTR